MAPKPAPDSDSRVTDEEKAAREWLSSTCLPWGKMTDGERKAFEDGIVRGWEARAWEAGRAALAARPKPKPHEFTQTDVQRALSIFWHDSAVVGKFSAMRAAMEYTRDFILGRSND